MDKLDKILEQFGDYGHHDNNGYGDCPTCKKVAEAKQAIQQELLKARLDELDQLLENIYDAPYPEGCQVVHEHDIADRIAELQSSPKDGGNDE